MRIPFTVTVLAVAFASNANAVAQTPRQFVVRTPPAVAANVWSYTVAFDFDGDGDLDILGVVSFGFFYTSNLLRNDGVGRFQDVTATHLPAGIAAEAAVIPMDFDGDGDLDLFFAGTQNQSVFLKNNGVGVFSVHATMNGVSGITGAAAGDLDGDGDLDLFLVGTPLLSGLDQVLANNGSGTFTVAGYFSGFATRAVVLADVDGDHDLDVINNNAPGLRLLRNDGAMSFTDITATNVSLPPTTLVNDLTSGDFDGDGDIDLLGTVNGAPLDMIIHNQGGILTFAGSLPAQAHSQSITVGDVDMDGDLDAMRMHAGGVVSLSLNDGLGNFTDATSRMPPHAIFSTHVLLADLDGDNDADLITCYSGLPANILKNRHVQLEAMPAVIGQAWHVAAYSEPSYATFDHPVRLAVSVALLPQPLPIPGLGSLWLDTASNLLLVDHVIAASSGRHAFAFPIPNAPHLIGIELHVQAIVDQQPARLTAYDSVVIQ